jgi:hypothetical protein
MSAGKAALGRSGRAQLILPAFRVWTAQHILPVSRIRSAKFILMFCPVRTAQHILPVSRIRSAELILMLCPVRTAQQISCILIWLWFTIAIHHLYLLPPVVGYVVRTVTSIGCTARNAFTPSNWLVLR